MLSMSTGPNRAERRRKRRGGSDGPLPAAPTTIVLFTETPVHRDGLMIPVGAASLAEALLILKDSLDPTMQMTRANDHTGDPANMIATNGQSFPLYINKLGDTFIGAVCDGPDEIVTMMDAMGYKTEEDSDRLNADMMRILGQS